MSNIGEEKHNDIFLIIMQYMKEGKEIIVLNTFKTCEKIL